MLKGKTGAHRSSFNIELSFDKSALKRKNQTCVHRSSLELGKSKVRLAGACLMYFEFKCRIWEPELASVIETRENSATERRTF